MNLPPQVTKKGLEHRAFVELAAGTAATGAASFGALACGALAVGAFAFGAGAVGALTVGRLGVKHARFGTLEVNELIICRTTVVGRV